MFVFSRVFGICQWPFTWTQIGCQPGSGRQPGSTFLQSNACKCLHEPAVWPGGSLALTLHKTQKVCFASQPVNSANRVSTLRHMQTNATSHNAVACCRGVLANNVESVCMGLKVWPVSNYRHATSANIVVVPCKRTQHVGQNPSTTRNNVVTKTHRISKLSQQISKLPEYFP